MLGLLETSLTQKDLSARIFELSPDRTMESTDVEDLRLVECLRAGSERAYEDLLLRFQQGYSSVRPGRWLT